MNDVMHARSMIHTLGGAVHFLFDRTAFIAIVVHWMTAIEVLIPDRNRRHTARLGRVSKC
jgi:hypothetical protein